MERQTIGRYQIREHLGRGGMATVYLALDPRFQREVAVKLLPQGNHNDPQFRARFQREAQTVAALEHPAIVPVHDFGEDQGRMYLVMAYMTGGSLADRLREGPLPPAEAARILRRISSGLDQAHKQGIVHRDLKPANILFDRYDNAYLSDFGIVKLSQATSDLTGEGVIGTPSYMSPEQAQGDDHLDGRSDVYALGAILYTMLAGHVPYEAENAVGVLVKHISAPVPDLGRVAPNLAAYAPVIMKAMAKNPRDRYATANDMVLELDRIVGQQAVAPHAPPPPPYGSEVDLGQTGPAGARRIAPWMIGLVALFAVACLGGVIWGVLTLRDSAERDTPDALALDPGGPIVSPPTSESEGIAVPSIPTAGVNVQNPTGGTIVTDVTATPTSTTIPAPVPTATPTATPTAAPPTPTATPQVRNGPIVFDSADDIFIMDANGANVRQLTDNNVLDDEADISSDGRFIAYESYSGTEWRIMLMDIGGQAPRELVNGRQPDWSPDDRFIAFESETFPQQIYVVNVSNGQARQITNTPGHSRAPSWSPDGEQIVFMTEIGSNWQLAVVNVATGVHEVITSGPPDKRFPVWSPDGDLVAYNTLTATGGVDQIWTIEPDGDSPRRLTQDGQNGRPAWSPDGRFLAFNANRDGSWQIYQMNRDGSNQRSIADVADRQRPDWGNQWP